MFTFTNRDDFGKSTGDKNGRTEFSLQPIGRATVIIEPNPHHTDAHELLAYWFDGFAKAVAEKRNGGAPLSWLALEFVGDTIIADGNELHLGSSR